MKRFILFALLLLAACEEAPPPSNAVDLTGKWQGVEGTYLIVGPSDVKIADLDGERTFPATHAQNSVTFTRDYINETITPTDGAGTGMKWLAGKKDCVVVKPGEGYCRD